MSQQPVARLGDTSDHGGTIISYGTKFRCDGILVARLGDAHSCPTHGITSITTASPKVKSEGQFVAAITSEAGCGAKIITGSPSTTVPMVGGISGGGGGGAIGGGGRFILNNSLHDILNGRSILG
jgi:uncharacterized Zn-binding protein involved in type VI secretion